MFKEKVLLLALGPHYDIGHYDAFSTEDEADIHSICFQLSQLLMPHIIHFMESIK